MISDVKLSDDRDASDAAKDMDGRRIDGHLA